MTIAGAGADLSLPEADALDAESAHLFSSWRV